LTLVVFISAALLIQGSACIYSKKVEYLYLLIYKTLELLVEKRFISDFHSFPISVSLLSRQVSVDFAEKDSLMLFISLENKNFTNNRRQ
jgi:condensin-2 complex subunit H2